MKQRADWRRKLAGAARSGDFRNVFYSLLSYCITPVVLLASTPLLLKHLGERDYGLWILVNALLQVLMMSNFGLGNALIKLGAELRDEAQFNALFRVTLTWSVALAAALNIALPLFGAHLLPLLAGEEGRQTILSLSYLLGGIVGIRIVNGVLSGAYMAKQRYDVNSKVNIVFHLFTAVVFTALAVAFGDLTLLVQALFLFTVLLLAGNYFVARRVVPQLRFGLSFDRGLTRRLLRYGIYSWGQIILSTLNAQADKVIVGALLGVKTLGVYTVCMQLAAKLHEIPAAAGGYLMPKFSSLEQAGRRQETQAVYRRALRISGAFVAVGGAAACLLAEPVLSVWIGPSFARENGALFQLLALSVALGAFGVVPYYFLNGTGHVRLNTILSLLTTLATLASFFALIPAFGASGIAIGKLAAIPLVVFSLIFCRRLVRGGGSRPEEGDGGRSVLLFDQTNSGHHYLYNLAVMKGLAGRSSGAEVTYFSGLRDPVREAELRDSGIGYAEYATRRYYRYLPAIAVRLLVLAQAVRFARQRRFGRLHLLYLDTMIIPLFALSPLLGRLQVTATLHWYPLRPVKRRLLGRLLKRLAIAKLIVHGEYLRRQVTELCGGSAQVSVIAYPNLHAAPAANIRAPGPAGEPPAPAGPAKLLCFGGLRYDKGIDLLLDAAAALKQHDFRIMIAGKEEDFTAADLERRIGRHGLEDKVITRLGYIPDEEVAACFEWADFIVLPYRKMFSGQSGPLTEGAARSKIIIGPDHGEIGYSIAEYRLGVAFRAEDVDDLRRALRDAMNNRESLAAQARQSVYKQLIRPGLFQQKYVEELTPSRSAGAALAKQR